MDSRLFLCSCISLCLWPQPPKEAASGVCAYYACVRVCVCVCLCDTQWSRLTRGRTLTVKYEEGLQVEAGAGPGLLEKQGTQRVETVFWNLRVRGREIE